MSKCQTCDREAGDAFACKTCAANAREDLVNIAHLAVHLDEKRARIGSNWSDGPSSPAAEQPLPYDPRVSRVADPIRIALWGASRIVLEGRPAASAYIDGGSISQVAVWLAQHVDWLRMQPEGPEEFSTIVRCRENIMILFDRQPDSLYIGRCKSVVDEAECEQALYVDTDQSGKPDAATVECRRCQSVHDVDSRREELRESVKNYLGTIKEIASLCKLIHGDGASRTMLYSYAEHGLLEAKGKRLSLDATGRVREAATYCIGDVDEAIVAWRKRQEALRGSRKRRKGNAA